MGSGTEIRFVEQRHEICGRGGTDARDLEQCRDRGMRFWTGSDTHEA